LEKIEVLVIQLQTTMTPPLSENIKTNLALVFVGSLVPDQPDFRNLAFNRAGNMFQENLLLGLKKAGLPASLILSQRPLRTFPFSRRLWAKPGKVDSNNGLPIVLIPFLNLPLFRPVSVGLAVLVKLVLWGWKNRGATHRIVYSFNLTEPPGFFSLFGARLIRARAIASVNDINIPGETVAATLSRRLDFYLHKKLLPRFDGLVVVNKCIIEHFAPSTPFVRMEGGVNEAFFQRVLSCTRRLNEKGTQFTIVSAGTLYKINGIMEILEAFALLSGTGYRLRIAGSGPLSEKVKQAAKADPRIEYCGYLSFEKLMELYASADVLINMRLTKTLKTEYFFPSKVLEYLASGTPVITTCTGHVEEDYSGFVFLLKDESPQGLARIIREVAAMEPDSRVQKGRAAQAYIKKHKTWAVQGQRAFEFIRDLCYSKP
jgi:glycosyltransferase involved in cell wall biosynthesis